MVKSIRSSKVFRLIAQECKVCTTRQLMRSRECVRHGCVALHDGFLAVPTLAERKRRKRVRDALHKQQLKQHQIKANIKHAG